MSGSSGPVGDDFGDEHLAVLDERGIATDDIERVAGGETFFWRGHYDHDMNVAHTDDTQLNVFADFEPEALARRRARRRCCSSATSSPSCSATCARQSLGELRGAGLDEPLDRDRARLAARGDRRGRLPAAQRRRAADADRASRTSSRRRGRRCEIGPEVVVAKRGEYGAALFTADELVRDPRAAAGGRPRPDRRRRQLRRRLPRLPRRGPGHRRARRARPCARRWPTAR